MRKAMAGPVLLIVLAATAPPSQRLRYTLDPAASEVSARVAFFGLSSKTARFPRMNGSIALDPLRAEAIELAIELDARALTAPDRVTLKRLKGEKFFWVERYPTVRFAGRRLALDGPAHGSVEGTITARGVTRPVTLAVTFSEPPAHASGRKPLTVTAETTIDRRAFGMTAYGLVVGRKVHIRVRAQMVPA